MSRAGDSPGRAKVQQTVPLTPEDDEAAAARPAVPFHPGPGSGPPGETPRPARPRFGQTVELPADGAAAGAGGPVVPFRPPEAAPVAPAPAQSERQGEGAVTIERCGRIAAELREQALPRARVLAEHGLSEARWDAAERAWRGAIEAEVSRGGRALRNAYDAAYVEAWEALRGAIGPGGYARIAVALERGRLAPALQEAGIRRATWMRVARVWRQRMRRDPGLAAQVERALSALRQGAAE